MELKQIPLYPYKIRSDGAVFNSKGKQLKTDNKRGYHSVTIFNKSGRISKQVHRLVAQAFISNPENKPQVNHIDEVKHNNDMHNLEWCTIAENHRHSGKLNNCNVSVIRSFLKCNVKQNFIAKRYGVCFGTISKIKLGTIWA